MAFRFEVVKADPSGARLGRLTTSHGTIETPAFMPVGTAGTVKAMTQGGPGNATTNLPYYLYQQVNNAFDIGGAAATGVVTVILTIIVTGNHFIFDAITGVVVMGLGFWLSELLSRRFPRRGSATIHAASRGGAVR